MLAYVQLIGWVHKLKHVFILCGRCDASVGQRWVHELKHVFTLVGRCDTCVSQGWVHELKHVFIVGGNFGSSQGTYLRMDNKHDRGVVCQLATA